MDSWLTLHPKIAAQLKLGALAVVGQAILVIQGTETLTEAAIASGLALALLVQGYLKNA